MTDEQVRLVQESFDKVRPISEVTADLFYKRLFELDPSLRVMFKGDLKEQGKKLMSTLSFAVNGLAKLDSIVGAVEELGRRHVGYGVKTEHYATVGEALLWTLQQGLGDDFTSEVKFAWVEAYGLLAGVMQNATAEVA